MRSGSSFVFACSDRSPHARARRAPAASVVAIVVTSLLAACGSDGHAAPRDGKLVLEVGGAHGSLRQALRAAGVEVAAPRPLRSEGAADADTAPQGTANDRTDGNDRNDAAPAPDVPRSGDDVPAPPRAPSPPPEPDHVVVSLAPGQTLIHLARKHLGDGNRFREILELNGWTEVDSRRLQPGQRVKVPRTAKNRASR